MSCSSLWVMDKDFVGYESTEYSNSWLFSPIVWDVLLDKYMRADIQTPFGYKKSFITDSTGQLFNKLNQIINGCDVFYDRIIWEMSNQQIFYSKDKQLVSNAIKEALEANNQFDKSNEDNIGPLAREHIKERWLEIAKDISEIDEEEYPYFILKNTSCDDGVEYWFSKFNEDEQEYEKSSLKQFDKFVAEFVEISENHIINFTGNLDYFKKSEDK